MVQKSFAFDFEDTSPKSIAYNMSVTIANRAGMLALAKLLVKFSMGKYKQGVSHPSPIRFQWGSDPTGCVDDSARRVC